MPQHPRSPGLLLAPLPLASALACSVSPGWLAFVPVEQRNSLGGDVGGAPQQDSLLPCFSLCTQGCLGACIQTFEPSLLGFHALGLTGWLGVAGKLREKICGLGDQETLWDPGHPPSSKLGSPSYKKEELAAGTL